MYGEIIKKKKNKIGVFVTVLGENKVSYYGDSRGIAKDVLASLCVGDRVEFEGEPSSTGNPTVRSLAVTERVKKINLEFSEDEKEKIKQLMIELSVLTTESGYYLASEMPRLIEQCCHVDYKLYAKTIADFVDRYLSSEFTFIKEIKVANKRIPNVVVPNIRVGDFVIISAVNELTQDIIESMENRIQEIIDINGVFLCSLFPSFIREFGIDDYRDYASSVDSFVEKFLSNKFTAKRNVRVGDKYYPDVIVPITTANVKYTEQEDYVLGDLIELYNASDWEGFLTSPLFVQIDTSALSMETIQMGLSCARKILDQDNAEIKLSLFQRELIASKTTRDFIKKWKKGSEFNNIILQSYTETSMCNLCFDNDKNLVSKILNDLGRDTKPNTTFTSLISRFEAVKDRLLPYLYVIRLYGCKSAKAIEQSVAEYCYFIKQLNEFSTKKIQKKSSF